MEGVFEIKKVPVWPVIRVVFIVFLILGILIGILYSIIFSGLGFLAGGLGGSPFNEDLAVLRGFGFIMIPVIAFTYAIFGTIWAVIGILLYNLIASIAGGVELTLMSHGAQPPPREPERREAQSAHVPQQRIDGF